MHVRAILLGLGLCVLPPGQVLAEPAGADARAEASFSEGGYQRAHEIYAGLEKKKLPAAEARWVRFRAADCLWRSRAAAETPDTTQMDAAVRALREIVGDVERPEDRDRVWAEAQESLGDYHWRPGSENWWQAWQHYLQAMDWWAGAADVELARRRYLRMGLAVLSPPGGEDPGWYNSLPLQAAEDLVRIARSPQEQARARFLLASSLRQQGDYETLARVPEELEKALLIGKQAAWYDDALFAYAQLLESPGRVVQRPDGGVEYQPDYPGALKLYRRLLAEFKEGESRHWPDARDRIRGILEPSLGLGVSQVFLPGSEVVASLAWRNLGPVSLSLHEVDLTRDVRLEAGDGAGSYLARISLERARRVQSWTHATQDQGEHRPGSAQVRVPEPLPPGAYLLEARADKLVARELVLVTDAVVVVRAVGERVLVFLADAQTGQPLDDARVTAQLGRHDGGQTRWELQTGATGADGLADLRFADKATSGSLFVAARAGRRQAFSLGSSQLVDLGTGFKLYAFTDRPAYRPEDTVHWKLIARKREAGAYLTPAGQTLRWEILDPRGAKTAEGESKLNAFGSAWGELPLSADMTLGEYRVVFRDASRNHLGTATLFRLEEYKLPEFSVQVRTPEEAGQPRTFRPGERVEAEVVVEYYFGGGVQGADVEVLIHQTPFYPGWGVTRDYPWFYDDMPDPWARRGYRQTLRRERLKTDASGRALLRFDTPRGAGADMQYDIEARVTDASRREVVGAGRVRVSGQRFFVQAQAAHALYRPGDKVQVVFRAQDANERPVAAQGEVRVTRERWHELWLDPKDREVSGPTLQKLRGEGAFPPGPGWRLRFQGYRSEEVLKREVRTAADGRFELDFPLRAEGFYRVAWLTVEPGRNPIQAETNVWVASEASADLGYQHGGLGLLLDRDTVRVGETLSALVLAPPGRRWVLFSVEGQGLESYRLLKIDGALQRVDLPIAARHVPNLFLNALMVSERQVFSEQKQVVVPPEDHFLDVQVSVERAELAPGEEAVLRVQARDRAGRPAAAELALALVDESVTAIQQDYAGDPRPFFFGQKRAARVQTLSTFQQRAYARLVRLPDGRVVDESQAAALLAQAESEARLGQESQRRERAFAENEDDGFASAELASAPPADMGPGAKRDEARRAAAPSMKSMVAPSEPSPVVAPSGPEPAVVVRADFRATALWRPDLVTGPDGRAEARVRMPDSLTRWQAVARAVTREDRVGRGESVIRTRMPLMVRLQAPRFFVQGDEVVVSAVVNNHTAGQARVGVSLEVEGLELVGGLSQGRLVPGGRLELGVPASGAARADWKVRAVQDGPAKLRVKARAGAAADAPADAMERSFTVHPHGLSVMLAEGGKLRGQEARVTLELPPRRATRMTVQVAPSQAAAMLDALPYLIEYPYGCTEQTMSRFLPLVAVARTLQGLGVGPEALLGKVFGGLSPEARAALKTRESGELARMQAMIQAGLERLYDFQHGDGGWGWWKDGESDRSMTAYVVWGLGLALEAGVKVKPEAISRGLDFLHLKLVEQERSPDRQAWMLHALSVHHARVRGGRVHALAQKALENLWARRAGLNAYTRALFLLACKNYGQLERARALRLGLANGVTRDRRPDASVVLRGEPPAARAEAQGTAYWGQRQGFRQWSEGAVETTAFVVRALLALDPKDGLAEPAVQWLLKNRRGAHWSNTRDTAIALLALDDYLRVSGELKGELDVLVEVNGRKVGERRLVGAELVTGPSVFEVDPAWLRDGKNQIRIVKRKGKAVYFQARAEFFSLEEPVRERAHELFVRRQYYRWRARPSLLKGDVLERVPLGDGDTIQSGERVEVVLSLETKFDTEYLVLEDLKPAGFEAVDLRSGEGVQARQLKAEAVAASFGSERGPARDDWRARPSSASFHARDYTGQTRAAHRELRDRKVALFVDRLGQGFWELRYDLRAEAPGVFHALPVTAHAMYVPDVRANSDEVRVTVLDRP
jgi:hypothetical protein